jgi:hypothetical protein
MWHNVTTLAMGSRPRQRLARLRAKKAAWKSHLMFPIMQKSVREWTLTLPNELPFWEFKSQWTSKSSKGDCKGQNPSIQNFLYIIKKLLKHRCLKWAHITHLDISNTSYGQKKGWESNWQFNSWSLNIKNWPDFLTCRWCATYH